MDKPASTVDYQYFYVWDETWTPKSGWTQQLTPRITVCYIRVPPEGPMKAFTAIGIAICSELDIPNKTMGKAIAHQRAVHVISHRGLKPIIWFEALPIVSTRGISIVDASDMYIQIDVPVGQILFKSMYREDPKFRFQRREKANAT